jgi:hypothetical protein
LKKCGTKLNIIFPSFQPKSMTGWGSPYTESSAQPENVTLWEEEELCKLQSVRTPQDEIYWPIPGQVLDLCERRFSCHWQESNKHVAAVFDFLHVWVNFFLFNEYQDQNRHRLLLMCDYLKFVPKLFMHQKTSTGFTLNK